MSDIPVIDISNANVGKSLVDAATGHGFFYVSGHGVDPTLICKIFKLSQKFFSLDASIKLRYARSPWNTTKNGRNGPFYLGYFPANVDGKEGYDIGWNIKRTDQEIKSMCNKDQICPWHDEKTPCADSIENFGDVMQEYFDCLTGVAKTIMSKFAEGMGKEKAFFDPYFNYHGTTLRLNYYPRMVKTHLKGEQDNTPLACGEHADTGIITILLQDEVGGLEVYDTNTSSWIPVPPKKDMFIVNLGKLFVRWANSKFQAGFHRVRFTPNTERISIPFFYCPNYYAKIESIFYRRRSDDGSNSGSTPLIYGPWCVEQMKRFKEYDPERMLAECF